jgi:hypothetical protein
VVSGGREAEEEVKVLRVVKGTLANLDPQVLLDHLVKMDLKALVDQQAKLDCQVSLERMVTEDSLEKEVLPVKTDH